MKRVVSIAALALPVIALALGIAGNEASLVGARTYRIPVTGYDPRDPIRGRYVVFQYGWQVVGDARECRSSSDCPLCLEEGGRKVRVTRASCSARIDPLRSELSILTTSPGVRASSRIWLSEATAPSVERQLRTRPMVVVARLTRDGRLINDRLVPER